MTEAITGIVIAAANILFTCLLVRMSMREERKAAMFKEQNDGLRSENAVLRMENLTLLERVRHIESSARDIIEMCESAETPE